MKIIKLYLYGLKGFFETNTAKPYNYYKKYTVLISSILLLKWYLHDIKSEFYKRRNPNVFIPYLIYKARKESYIYWELTRLSKGLNTTFTYYYYKNDFLFYVNKKGATVSEKNIINREKIDQINNPLFEEIVKNWYYTRDIKLQKIGNLLIAYNKNLYNRFNLNNYLFYKTINIMDVIRGLYFFVMTYFKFTNFYRYDHITSKNDILYEFEKIKLGFNLYNKNKYDRNLNIDSLDIFLKDNYQIIVDKIIN